MIFAKKNLKYLFVGFLFAIVVFVWYAVFWESRSGLMVAFLDVGQGDAVFIQAENNNQVLLDGGENKSILRQLSEVMPFYDRSIDVLILSHPHKDHAGGLVEVLKRYEISLVVEPCLNVGVPEYTEWKRLIEDKKITKICAKRGQKICLDEDLCFDILLPVGNVAGRKVHDAMLVSRLNYGDSSFLLAGDMEKNLEHYLVQAEGENLKSDILKIGHHGSKTSTSEMFLGYVNPKHAVISAGKDNKYSHPHQEILDRLDRFGISILRTDETGLIRTKSNDHQVLILTAGIGAHDEIHR
jgi:competence protein ComEC